MSRYFIEVSYKGTRYAGFQVQANANTIQAEVEKALRIYYKQSFELIGSSRTDTGVHAFQNFFHFDWDGGTGKRSLLDAVYSLNAILPEDIVIKKIFPVGDSAHSRFDARLRSYRYRIYLSKDPFLQDRAYYYPFELDVPLLQAAAKMIHNTQSFESFSKRNTQVQNFECNIAESYWWQDGNSISYNISANRFLRGMVRGLVATMLRVGRKKCSLREFQEIIDSKNPGLADFSVPPQGLTLCEIKY